MLNKKTVNDLKGLQGKKVLARCNLNVPLKEGVTQNYSRINGAIPTTKKLPDQGAKVILCSYLGKPKGEPVLEMSLAPVAPALGERLDIGVKFVDDSGVTGSGTRKVATELKDEEVLLPQNTRYRGEEVKFKDDDAASEAYAKELADLYGGIFVNNAFGTAHRAHCSSVGATGFTRENMVGYLMEKKIKFLGQATKNLVRPFVAVLGGARAPDKVNVINNLLDKADTLIIDGGMTYIFMKAQGQEIGNSLYKTDKLDYALEMIKEVEEKDVRLLLPVDHAERKEFFNDTEYKVADMIDAGWSGFDIGPRTIALYKGALQDTKTVVRNGPTGVFKFSNFVEDVPEVCRAIADLADATTVIGGGNSVNAVKRLGLADKMIHISIGGGTSLKFLEGKKLSGMAATDSKA